MQTMVPLYGFGGVPYSAVRKAAPRNILDNSDFRNPVNQRGIASGTAVAAYGYFIDRWINGEESSIAPNMSSNGIKPNGAFYQNLDSLASYVGKKMTFAVGLSSGNVVTASGTLTEATTSDDVFIFDTTDGSNKIAVGSDAGLWYVWIDYPSSTIQWAALYEGEYTAATLPEYHPKGYGAELAECQRYYQNLSTIDNAFDVVLNGFVSNTSTALAVSLPGMSKMRITPTVVFSGGIVIRGNNGYSSDATYGTPYMSPNVVPRLNTLVFYKSDNSAWAGIDNNTNISISLKLGSILSLSADL